MRQATTATTRRKARAAQHLGWLLSNSNPKAVAPPPPARRRTHARPKADSQRAVEDSHPIWERHSSNRFWVGSQFGTLVMIGRRIGRAAQGKTQTYLYGRAARGLIPPGQAACCVPLSAAPRASVAPTPLNDIDLPRQHIKADGWVGGCKIGCYGGTLCVRSSSTGGKLTPHAQPTTAMRCHGTVWQ